MTTTPGTKRDVAAVRRYVERMGLVLAELGMPRMSARVFAALMVSDAGKMTASELADELLVSPAAISGAVRYLDQVGMIEKRREPGERRDHYGLFDDLWYTTFLKRDKLITVWRDAAHEGIATLGEDSPGGKRVAEMRDFLSYLIDELPRMFERWSDEHRPDGE